MPLALALAVAATGCKHGRSNVTDLPTKPMAAAPSGPGPQIDQRNPITPTLGGNRPGLPAGNPNPIGNSPGLGDPTGVDTNPIKSTPIDPPVTNTNLPTNPIVEPLSKLHPPNEAGHPNWPADRETLRAQTVYFDYDKSSVKTGEDAKVTAVADYLRSNPGNAVLIEGHCDERGTEEYNRSLGERRALAVREVLIRLGIDAGRLDTVTYGKDRPAELGHNEAAWSKNRRDEFIVLTPPKQ